MTELGPEPVMTGRAELISRLLSPLFALAALDLEASVLLRNSAVCILTETLVGLMEVLF